MSPTEELLYYAIDFGVRNLSSVVLEDKRFPVWSGASKPDQHHYGDGCLAEHTLEVVKLCLLNNDYFKDVKYKYVNPKHLFLAALFHDAGKMWDYSKVNGVWTGNEHKRNVHHISRSGIVWSKAAAQLGSECEDEILHAILAHHGLREWGSPVAPNSRLAWLLHFCDGISARMDDCGRLDVVK